MLEMNHTCCIICNSSKEDRIGKELSKSNDKKEPEVILYV